MSGFPPYRTFVNEFTIAVTGTPQLIFDGSSDARTAIPYNVSSKLANFYMGGFELVNEDPANPAYVGDATVSATNYSYVLSPFADEPTDIRVGYLPASKFQIIGNGNVKVKVGQT